MKCLINELYYLYYEYALDVLKIEMQLLCALQFVMFCDLLSFTSSTVHDCILTIVNSSFQTIVK